MSLARRAALARDRRCDEKCPNGIQLEDHSGGWVELCCDGTPLDAGRWGVRWEWCGGPMQRHREIGL